MKKSESLPIFPHFNILNAMDEIRNRKAQETNVRNLSHVSILTSSSRAPSPAAPACHCHARLLLCSVHVPALHHCTIP